jgi:hypothetical protein
MQRVHVHTGTAALRVVPDARGEDHQVSEQLWELNDHTISLSDIIWIVLSEPQLGL